MLFRRCKTYITLLLMITSLTYADNKLDVYKKEGQKIGRSHKPSLKMTQQEIENLTPTDLRGQNFDDKQAKKQVLQNTYNQVESTEKNVSPELQAMVINSENLLKQEDNAENQGIEEVVTFEKCLFEMIVVPVSLKHVLNVQVNSSPATKQIIRICQGHHSEEKSSNPSQDKRKKKRKFAKDPTIKAFKVHVEKKGIFHRDYIVCDWTHNDNTESCSNFHKNEIVIPGKNEEEDIWQMENPLLLESLDCSLISTENGPPETRIINGREIFRPFWYKTHHLQCLKQSQKNCQFLNEKSCVLTAEKCIKKNMNQCLVWEKVFKCINRYPKKNLNINDICGTDSQIWETTPYKPNHDLPDVATKLAVFDEMKKELQNSQAGDARSVRLFTGLIQQCSKSIADDLMYDCCGDMDGFTNKIKLSKCTVDEIALAESKQKGLCHYIGKKKEKFLDLWTSHIEHVYCVFPTKLSRVFQEQARDQLQITWGDVEHPDCRGLTQEEIKKLDFSKMNLMEAFEIPKEIDNTEKIKKIESRLKERLKAAP